MMLNRFPKPFGHFDARFGPGPDAQDPILTVGIIPTESNHLLRGLVGRIVVLLLNDLRREWARHARRWKTSRHDRRTRALNLAGTILRPGNMDRIERAPSRSKVVNRVKRNFHVFPRMERLNR